MPTIARAAPHTRQHRIMNTADAAKAIKACEGPNITIVSTISSMSIENLHNAKATIAIRRTSKEKPSHFNFGRLSEKLDVNEYFKITRRTEAPSISGRIISGANGPNRGIIQYCG